MSEEKVTYLDKPFRVSHENGDVIQGFDDLASAEADAEDRNARAKQLKLTCSYAASAKP